MSMLDTTLNIYRAVGEETRLRIAVLLSRGELTVTELTQILGQSQPRVSRHLKILADAGLVERYREGAWMFYRLLPQLINRHDHVGFKSTINLQGQTEIAKMSEMTVKGEMASNAETAGMCAIYATLDALAASSDRVLARDRDRFTQSREARAAIAAAYFEQNAAHWDEIRRLHLPESDIETQIKAMIGQEKIELFVDLGTGTGRMLEVFSDLYEQAIGYDASREMLAVARANLDASAIDHAQVRFGDIFTLPLASSSADLVCIHQVLHFLTEPGLAVREASKILKPHGRLIITDFAPHDLEFLREDHAHRRLGFSDDEVRDWCQRAGLDYVRSQTLSPIHKNDEERLTVKIWLCTLGTSTDYKPSIRSLKTNNVH